MLVGIIIVIALALAIVLVVLGRRSAAPGPGTAPAIRSDDFDKLHLAPADFTVEGEIAIVSFDVVLPPGDVDPVLADVLVRQAVEVVREKRSRGLPLDDITTVRVLGRREGSPVEAASLSLEEPGSLPPPPDGKVPDVTEAEDVEFDPLHRLAERVGSGKAAAVSVSRGDELPPLKNELRLTASLEAALRASGVTPETMKASDLTLSLLAIAGYQVTAASAPGTYLATRSGTKTFIGVVDHEPGAYPELSESAVNSFLASFYSSGADRGLLFSDKFSPHLVYEKERRDRRVRFITRERMQAFADTIAVL